MSRLLPVGLLLLAASSLAHASVDSLICTTSATPLIMHAEEITDAVGSIEIVCTGGPPSASMVENVTILLNVPVTNRISAPNVTDAVFTADSGSGPVAVSSQGLLMFTYSVVWNDVHLTLSPTGSIVLRLSNIRVDSTAATPSPNGQITADVIVGGEIIEVNQPELAVGTTFTSLYSNNSTKLVCAQSGATVPSTLSFSQFIAAKAVFTSTRVTEGFASALLPKSDPENYDADTGDRILVTFTDLSPLATLYVPVAVAGSDAIVPTAGGDLGVAEAGGTYAPNANGGSLLLSLVSGADANGAGGKPLYTPAAPGSGPVTFDKLVAIPVSSAGSASIVYEVKDASDTTQETAQFPTFLAVPPTGNGITYTSNETVTLAPVSTVLTASITGPVPRFVQTEAPNDCAIVGDCNAPYFPHLSVSPSSMNFTVATGSSNSQFLDINNIGSGQLTWSATIVYADGSGTGWLSLSPTSWDAAGGTNVTVDATHVNPGVWNATILISSGPIAGHAEVGVTANVTPTGNPTIRSVSSSANILGPATAGSLATIAGTGFVAPVTVTFDGQAAQILASNSTSLNVLVPASLGGQASTQLVVSNNGVPMPARTVPLAAFSPGIFPGAVLNQDFSVNGSAHPASPGSVVQIWGTGISASGVVTGLIGDQPSVPEYAGPAPGYPGVQQVNVPIPASDSPGNYFLQLCESATAGGTQVCSPPASLVIGK
jgi:uncharacterized protein (TIGR03437 family)